MEQSVSAMIMAMLVVFVFIPALFMGMLNSNRQKIQEAMYLSTKCLVDCVETDEYSLEEIAMGYGYSDDPIMRVRIDEPKLFTEFDDILFRNINNIEQYTKIKNNILCEMIIYPDRYVVWDKSVDTSSTTDEYYYSYSSDKEYDAYQEGRQDYYVSAPKYFSFKRVNEDGNDVIEPIYDSIAGTASYYYINTINDKIRKMGDNNAWRNVNTLITDTKFSSKLHYKYEEDKVDVVDYNNDVRKNLTTYDKNQIIIDTLNKEIAYYTNGVKMDFINPASVRQKRLKPTKQEFNFFSGITFLVVYREDSAISSGGNLFEFNHYQVAGFTLEN